MTRAMKRGGSCFFTVLSQRGRFFPGEIIQTFAIIFHIKCGNSFHIAVNDMGIGKTVNFEIDHHPFGIIQFVEGEGKNPELVFKALGTQVMMKVNNVIDMRFPDCRDEFIEVIIVFPQLVNIGVVFQEARKFFFGKIMDFGSFHLFLKTSDHWRGQDNIAD